jgi:hypothetical protein
MNCLASIFGAAALIPALAACGPRITNDNLEVVNHQRQALEKLGKGLSPKEVESILGQPRRAETFTIPLETRKPTLDGLRYFYEQDGETVELHFVDNKLISEIPKLGQTPATPPTK